MRNQYDCQDQIAVQIIGLTEMSICSADKQKDHHKKEYIKCMSPYWLLLWGVAFLVGVPTSVLNVVLCSAVLLALFFIKNDDCIESQSGKFAMVIYISRSVAEAQMCGN